MSNITEELVKIINAVKGKEVRQSIHDGIKKAYDDASVNGNANMEVELARGTFKVLNDRLGNVDSLIRLLELKKADQSFVDAQLASIISGAPTGTYKTLAALKQDHPNGTEGVFLVLDDGHWYYWNEAEKDWLDGGLYQAVSWEAYMYTQDEEVV